MLRVPVRPSEFLVGKPIPFDVFDRHGRLLLAKGHVIASAEEKEKLLRQGAERNLTTDERFRQAIGTALKVVEKEEEPGKNAIHLDFEELRLLPGAVLQIQLGKEEDRYFVRYIGALRGRSVIIDALERGGLPLFVPDGTALQVRGSVGSYAFVFPSSVLVNASRPYPHLHLTYPMDVVAVRLRRSERVPVRLVAAVVSDDNRAFGGVILDLSVGGGLLATRHPLKVGQRIQIKFKLEIAGTEIILAVPAIVRSERDIEDRTLEGARGYGIEFVDLTPEDTVALMTYIAAVQINPAVLG
ncbi:flagellar brake protein [Tepidiphilus margaritifer]|uniref:flagellar brake protein n=1 Tax=Tepidiphilus margaritifer TaxID=203471 RepID=UPI000426C8E1|nr:flagellar brake protein [Tepidiphilus margaritifer]